MKHWFAKELSKLAHVSVRTLHHYDRIGLLKPSLRQSNGYRLYSEEDLLKLQQIIALKFFGFELSHIKILLTNHGNFLENFTMQSKFLQKKAETLIEASTILKRIAESCSDKKSIPWEQIIQLIEVYHMTQHLEHSWVKEIFNPEELKQYAAFKAELKTRFPGEKKAKFEEDWLNLAEEIKRNIGQDPKGEVGLQLGKKFMELINSLYGKKYAHLRTKKFEKGFGEGKGLEETGLTPESMAWLEQAVDTYWRQRIYDVLAQVDNISSSDLLILWNAMMDDMYGEDEERKRAIPALALCEDNISEKAKNWLKNTFNL